jgi:cytoskeletal protein CcmA (bactofilin family)
MRKSSWLALSLVGAVLLVIFGGARAQAWTEFKSGNEATVSEGDTLDRSLWAGARTIEIAGTVNGDVFCGAMPLNISGTVKGDVICGAQTVNISGTVEGDIRVGAQTITTDSNSKIGGDASFGATDTYLNGSIGRDLAVGGNTVRLYGNVGRDIRGTMNHLNLASTAKVGGGIDYTSNDKINMANGAEVSGKVTQTLPDEGKKAWVHLGWLGNALALIFALLLLVTALVITALLPRLVQTVSRQGLERPWWVLLTGFLASIFVPIIIVLLMLTIIGIPLGILLLLGWMMVALTSGLFAANYIGRVIWHTQRNPLMTVLIGGVVLLILFMIPYVGFFMMLVAFWIGSGMVLLELKDRYRKPSYNLK